MRKHDGERERKKGEKEEPKDSAWYMRLVRCVEWFGWRVERALTDGDHGDVTRLETAVEILAGLDRRSLFCIICKVSYMSEW